METYGQDPRKVRRPCENETLREHDAQMQTLLEQEKIQLFLLDKDGWRPAVKNLTRSGDLARTGSRDLARTGGADGDLTRRG